MWVKTASLQVLSNAPAVFNYPPRQIVVFKVDSHTFALDNRCPHEGYPLAAGSVGEACVLTCNWHNWKFRLDDGECILGGDNVRVYPTRVEDDYVWVDLAPLPSGEARTQILRGLKTAFDKRDYSRSCRELGRLHYHDIDLKDAFHEALRCMTGSNSAQRTPSPPVRTGWL